MSRTTYADLSAVIGTTWGAGDGSTTFNLPEATDGAFWLSGATNSVGDTIAQSIQSHTHTHTLTTDNDDANHTHTQAAHNHTATDNVPKHTQHPKWCRSLRTSLRRLYETRRNHQQPKRPLAGWRCSE